MTPEQITTCQIALPHIIRDLCENPQCRRVSAVTLIVEATLLDWDPTREHHLAILRDVIACDPDSIKDAYDFAVLWCDEEGWTEVDHADAARIISSTVRWWLEGEVKEDDARERITRTLADHAPEVKQCILGIAVHLRLGRSVKVESVDELMELMQLHHSEEFR